MQDFIADVGVIFIQSMADLGLTFVTSGTDAIGFVSQTGDDGSFLTLEE